MIMEDVIYGVMLSAKTDICSKEPPVKALNKLNASPVFCAKKSLIKLEFTPGVGSCDPILITINIKNV